MKRTVRAVYPGSFDPITNGHIYIAERAAAIFDEVRVSILINSQKRSMFSVDERCMMAHEALSYLPNVTVGHFEGLLIDYLRQQKSRVIIRGLRAMSDFEYEFQMALMNRQLAPEIETFFIVTDPKYSYLSSSAIRDIFQFGGTVQNMVPPGVFRRMRERFPRHSKYDTAKTDSP
ncbi:MAG: pantetheine-phosphate adenylyltransferase [Synergistaceae bacterium]|nr:pantetheine-phosphate adenylyltransferase [Synergistaceae bacterium]